jgi:hypothetical protein
MNLKILSENMLRFGTKNLSESNINILKEQAERLNLNIGDLNFNYAPGDFRVPRTEYNNLVTKLKPLRDALASGKYANMKHAIVINATATASQLTPPTIAKYFTPKSLISKLGTPKGGEANKQNDNKILAAYRAEYLYRAIISLMVREGFIVKDTKGNQSKLDRKSAQEMFPKKITFGVGATRSSSGAIQSTGEPIKFPPPGKKTQKTGTTEILKPLSCNFNSTVSGRRGKPETNYVSKTIRKQLKFGKKSTMELVLDPFTYPDAVYWKCGDKEGFTGFSGFSQGGAVSWGNRPERGETYGKFFKDNIYPKQWAGKTKDRQFTAELVWWEEYSKLPLTTAIQNVINEVGGKLQVGKADLFPNYEKAAAGVKAARPKFARNLTLSIPKWRRSTEGGFGEDVYRKIILPKELDGQEIIIKAFGPLDGTRFNLKAECS